MPGLEDFEVTRRPAPRKKGGGLAQFEVTRDTKARSEEPEAEPADRAAFLLRNLGIGFDQSIGGAELTGAKALELIDLAANAITPGEQEPGMLASGAQSLREEAARTLAEAEARKQPGDDSFGARAAQTVGALPIGAAKTTPALLALGPIGGMAAMGALEAKDEDALTILKEAAVGGAEGYLFPLTRSLGPVARAATVGGGTAGIELLAGRTPTEAALAGLVSGVLTPLDSSTTTSRARAASAIDDGVPRGARESTSTTPTAPDVTQPAPRGTPDPAAGSPIDFMIRRMEGELSPGDDAARAIAAAADTPLVEVLRRSQTPGVEGRVGALNKFLGMDFSDLDPPDRVFNINMGKMKGPEDVKLVIETVAKQMPDRIEDARGATTIAAIDRFAETLGLDENAKRLLLRKKGEAFNAQEIRGAQYVLVKAASEIESMSNKVLLGKATELDKANLLQSYGVFETILEQYTGAVAEAGRALRVLRENVKVGNVSANMLKLFPALKKMSGDADPAMALAELVKAAKTPGDLARGLRKAREATTMDAFLEVYTNMLLSNPTTAVVNPLSNSLVVAQGIAEQYGAAAQGMFRKGPDKVTFGEATAHAFGTVQAAKDALVGFGRVFMRRELAGENPVEIRQGAVRQAAERMKGSESGVTQLLGKGLGAVEPGLTVFTRLLSAQDAFFKEIAKRQSLNAQGYREGRSKGLRGGELGKFIGEFVKNPPESAMGKARDYALKQTYQAPLGETGQKFQSAIQSNPGLRILFPFFRTPTNIFKYAAERTPVGFLMKEVRNDLFGRNGKAAADLARAKMAMSTASMVAIASWVADGTLDGAGPRDPVQRATWLAAGHRPYSIHPQGLGKSEPISYARLEPIGTLLGIAADFNEISAQIEREGSEELAAKITTAFMRNLGSKTFLQGMTSLANAITDPDRYGGNFVSRLFGSFVPSGLAQYERVTDPIVRDAQTTLDAIKARLPGYSETLPARIGVWGEPIMLDPGVGPDMISPLYIGPRVDDKTKLEASRLNAALTPPRRNEWGFELTPQEFSELSKLAGQRAYSAVDRYVKSAAYERTPNDTLRRSTIEKLYNAGKSVGKTIYLTRLAARDPTRLARAKMATVEEKTGLDLQ